MDLSIDAKAAAKSLKQMETKVFPFALLANLVSFDLQLMKPPGPLSAAPLAAMNRIASARPRFRAAFFLPLVLISLAPPLLAQQAPAPIFVNWPGAISNTSAGSPVTFSNPPGGLFVTNTTQPSISVLSQVTPGFAATTAPGWAPGSPQGAINGYGLLNLYFTPGVNSTTTPQTNKVTITLSNIAGYSAANQSSASTNIDIVVFPAPNQLEIRFYNSSTNPPDKVYILPNAKDAPPNPNFTWTNNGTPNSWTNWMATTTNMTVTLADIGVTGQNTAGKSYYSVYTTNMNNSAWWVSYGGGHLPAPPGNGSAWNGTTLIAQPPSANTPNGPWAFHQWNTFEITLAGAPEDVGDTTYINQFSIPLAMRVFTSNTTDSTAYYQHGGFTNFSKSAFDLVASNLVAKYTNALWYAPDGSKAVLISFPSSAAVGTVLTPAPSAITTGTLNSFPLFTDYFSAVKANTARTTKIKDMISLDDTNGGNGAWQYFYDFNLTVTASNTLLLSGSIFTTNNSTTGQNVGKNVNTTGLTMEVSADSGGPTDNWASWTVYTAPTPAGFTFASPGAQAPDTLMTNSTNSWVPASVQGQRVLKTSANWQNVAAFSGYAASGDIALYNNKFGTAVMGRILGDMAAGFALGFINSHVVNPAFTANYTNVPTQYGDSPSGSWWGGNQFFLCGTNRLAFSAVQPGLSPSGNTFYAQHAGMINDGLTKLAYVHPIYDRMQVYGGRAAAAGTPKDQLQPSTATNAIPPIFIVELEMYDGLLSAPQPVLPPSPGARPVYQTVTNAFANAIGLVEGKPMLVPAVLNALNMQAPASWTITGLPAGLTYVNVTNNGIVQASISGTPSAGSGLNPQRIYAITAVMSNGLGLVATNVSGPLNPTSLYMQVSTTGVSPANTPATLVGSPSSLAPMSTTINTPSSPDSLLAQGVNLSSTAVTVTAPSGFEVSTNSASGFGATATLTAAYDSSLLTTNLPPTPVYVRLAANANSGPFSGNVSIASASVPSVQVAVSGIVGGTPTPTPTPSPSPTPTPAVPSLTVTPLSTDLGITTVGAPSTPVTISVSGTKLTGNVTVSAPAGVAVSTNQTTYTTVITLTPSGGNVGPTTVYARMPANTVGSPNGNIAVRSTGAATHNVAVQGTVNPAQSAAIIPTPTGLTKFAAISPNASAAKSFTVKTVSINQNINVTAPANFQVALKGEGFGNALTLPSKGGAVNVRIAPGAPVGSVSGSVLLQSGATTANVSVNGAVNPAPTPKPSPTPKPTPTPTPGPGITLNFAPATVTLPSTALGTASQAGFFVVSGSGLGANNVVIAGDNPNFQLALSSSGPWSANSVTLTPVGGSIANVAVYARTTGATQGSFTDDIVAFVGGQAQAYGMVNGTVGPAQQQSLELLPVSLGGYQTTQGTPSAYQLMELKGSGFASKTVITVDAPPGFQIALKASGPWGKSVAPNSTQLPIPLYVRLSGNQAGFLPSYSYSGSVYAYGGQADASASVSGNTYPAINLGVSATKLAGFATTVGTSSVPQRVFFGPQAPCFYTGPITITAPAKYEISTDGVNYTPSISYTVPGGDNGTQWVDDLFIRISAKAAKGTANGTVTLNTPNLPANNPAPLRISVSGSVK